MISIAQLNLVQQNAPYMKLSEYAPRADFFLIFLTHLQEFFGRQGRDLSILDPLFEDDAGRSEATKIGIDEMEFGDIYFLVDDFNQELTLFFFSERFSHKYFLMENEKLENISISTYCKWLDSLFVIHTSYLEETKK